MRETERMAEELRLLFEGPSWLGLSIDSLLAGISGESASSRPIGNAHTIWELVLHVAAWIRIARLRLTASSPVEATESENWPVASGDWRNAVAGLRTEAAALQEAIVVFPPDRLEEFALAGESQTFYVLLHGVIQHSAYHAGQIAVLKKVIS